MAKFAAFMVLAGLMAFLFLGDVSSGNHRYIDELFDFGHILLFGIASLAILNIISSAENGGRSILTYFLAGVITFLLGFITECIQLYIPQRQFALRDLLFDLIGSIIFLAIGFTRSNAEIRGVFSKTILLVSILLMGLCFLPTVTAVIDDHEMQEDFPIIGSFERSFEVGRWKVQNGEISRTMIYRTHGEYSLQVKLNPGKYPGISTRYFFGDWHDYDVLAFDIFLTETEPLKMAIRINDKGHKDVYTDRYNKTFLLNSKLNKIKIPLKDVMHAPTGRAMNMRSVAQIVLFASDLQRKITIFIDNIRLSKAGFSLP